MSKKKASLLFTIAVLTASFAVVAIPPASALTPRMDFNDNHYTARFHGGLGICGDHICKPGEYSSWQKAMSAAQMQKQGGRAMSGQHGEDVMHGMAGSSQGQNTMPTGK
ncbi:MAG: hypothetical protein E6K87_02810 [Thaumarchaeota archaeon]|nr:MAG: hypothetical protein AUI92_02150 [Thaumarchaeota archaeon 13_1_40CM_3_38_6]TLY04580.1 MAG: hypothetical protein E6K87_02810 [Nitrososphaerota archaeon]TLY07118.1 MAG: hypothetical protein E6K83_06510 [Nitrososphaerota archaeon]